MMTKIDVPTKLLELLETAEDGHTWKELQLLLRDKYEVRAHHGTISGALSNLHKSLEVFSIKVKRDNCKPYVHAKYRRKYEDEHRHDYPAKKNKWESMSDLLYFVMTEDNIPPNAWENALNSYRKMKNV